MGLNHTLGKRIKLARVECDMTQSDLAEKISMKQKSISRFESGESIPSLKTLGKIVKATGKSYSYFLDKKPIQMIVNLT